jgi:hypothetical protein
MFQVSEVIDAVKNLASTDETISRNPLAFCLENRRASRPNPLIHRIRCQINAARPGQCAVFQVCLRENHLIAQRVKSIPQRPLRQARRQVRDSGRTVRK